MMGSGNVAVLGKEGMLAVGDTEEETSCGGKDAWCLGGRVLDCSSAVTRRVWMADATL